MEKILNNKKKLISNNPKEELFVKNLKDFKRIFDKYNIKFWLDWGTLLGAVREGRIIPWDEDIDLGVSSDDYKKIILTFPEFKKKGFLVNEIPIPNTEFPCIKYSFTRWEVTIDVFSYYFQRDEVISFNTNFVPGHKFIKRYLWFLWRLLLAAEINTFSKTECILKKFHQCLLFLVPSQVKGYLIDKIKHFLIEIDNRNHIKKIILPRYYFEELKKIEFYGEKFNIPRNSEFYLERIYGKNWKKPSQNWCWTESSFVVKDNG